MVGQDVWVGKGGGAGRRVWQGGEVEASSGELQRRTERRRLCAGRWQVKASNGRAAENEGGKSTPRKDWQCFKVRGFVARGAAGMYRNLSSQHVL